MSQRQREAAKITGLANRRHGYSRPARPEYTAWHSMKQRCLDLNHKSYKDYGGRGIKVCWRWIESFEAFLEDMGDKPTSLHSIGRKNNDGDYEPDNCRWETRRQQYSNRRSSRLIYHKGTTKTVSEWARDNGMGLQTLLGRLRRKWPMEEALTKPSQLYGKYSRKKRN